MFLAANSTQNLGNLDADYKGAELEVTVRPTDRLDLYAGYGYTDSEITEHGGPERDRQPGSAGLRGHAQPRRAVLRPAAIGEDLTYLRADFQRIGGTWWEPYNITSRDPVNLLDARVGLGSDAGPRPPGART